MPIKPQYVKDVGDAILREYPEALTDDFGHNKRVVDETTDVESKTVRNRIAGYITRQVAQN